MLRDSLLEMTVDVLKSRLKLIATAKKVTRKADVIEEISRFVLSEKIKDYWQMLDELDQLAIAEALYYCQGHYYFDRFLAKYNQQPAYFLATGFGSKPVTSNSRYMGLFFYNRNIPEDLQSLLKKFVQKPEATQIITETELPENYLFDPENDPDDYSPVTVSITEVLIRHDLPVVLNLINQGKITVSDKTGVASSASIRSLEAVLSGGDYYQPEQQIDIDSFEGGPIRPIRTYAWPLLLQSSGLVKRNGKKLVLTRKGIKALTSPFSETIKLIYERWRNKGILDEYSRINLVKGQKAKGRIMADPSQRRIEIDLLLSACPVGKWISIDNLLRYIRAGDYDIKICHDYYRLYLAESGYGTLAYAQNPFEVLTGRYIMVYFFEYLATLGMIDIAYIPPYYARSDYRDLWGADDIQFLSRYDGLLYFRLNALGEYCLGLNHQYHYEQAETTHLFEINEQFELILTRNALPDEQQVLNLFAKETDNKQWELSELLTLEALEKGQNTQDFCDFLQQRHAQKLPVEVMDFFTEQNDKATAFSDGGRAQLIHSSSRLIKFIVSEKTTKNLCQQVDSRIVLVVDKKEKEFRKALKKLGYLLPLTHKT